MSFCGQDFFGYMKQSGRQQANQLLNASSGYITSVDPEKYTAKVMLEPLHQETGWLPIGSIYAGSGFGVVALPDIDTEVTVVFEMGNINCGKILLSNYNANDNIPSVSPGEVILIHKSGSTLKFNNNGDIEINPSGSVIIAGGESGVARIGDTIEAQGKDSQGNDIKVSGKITSGSSRVISG